MCSFIHRTISRFLDRATYGQSVIALLLLNGFACAVTSGLGRLIYRETPLFPTVMAPLFWLSVVVTLSLLLVTNYALVMSLIIHEMEKTRRGDRSWFTTQATRDRNRLLDEWAAETAKERTRS